MWVDYCHSKLFDRKKHLMKIIIISSVYLPFPPLSHAMLPLISVISLMELPLLICSTLLWCLSSALALMQWSLSSNSSLIWQSLALTSTAISCYNFPISFSIKIHMRIISDSHLLLHCRSHYLYLALYLCIKLSPIFLVCL